MNNHIGNDRNTYSASCPDLTQAPCGTAAGFAYSAERKNQGEPPA